MKLEMDNVFEAKARIIKVKDKVKGKAKQL